MLKSVDELFNEFMDIYLIFIFFVMEKNKVILFCNI